MYSSVNFHRVNLPLEPAQVRRQTLLDLHKSPCSLPGQSSPLRDASVLTSDTTGSFGLCLDFTEVELPRICSCVSGFPH